MYRIPVMPVMSTIKNHRNFYQVSTSPSPTMVVAKYLPLPPAWSTWRKQLPAARRASCTEVPAETKCTTATGPLELSPRQLLRQQRCGGLAETPRHQGANAEGGQVGLQVERCGKGGMGDDRIWFKKWFYRWFYIDDLIDDSGIFLGLPENTRGYH